MASGEQQLACPICQHSMTLRGLHGHLRIKHSKQKEEIMALLNEVPVKRGSDAEEVFNLLDLLKHLNERHEGLEILEERECFESDEVRKALFETLRGEAREIAAKLSESGVILEDGDIEAYCTLSRVEQN
jgi:hypothetical protein